jgi:hypothetical protein
LTLARVIDQDTPHELTCSAEKVSAILPLDSGLTNQTHIRLVHECRGLKRMMLTLPTQLGSGQAVKLGVDDGHEVVKRAPVAAAPGLEQCSDVRWWRSVVTHDPRDLWDVSVRII